MRRCSQVSVYTADHCSDRHTKGKSNTRPHNNNATMPQNLDTDKRKDKHKNRRKGRGGGGRKN